MKKAYLAVCVFAFIACLTGIHYLVEGISARGFGGVNYGRIIFPLLIMGISLWRIKRAK